MRVLHRLSAKKVLLSLIVRGLVVFLLLTGTAVWSQAADATVCKPADLEQNFYNVPTTDKPWAYWWWINGHVDEETITRDMEAMRRVGFGGLLMFDARGYWDDSGHVVLPKPKMEFMSPEWRKLLAFGIKEAARVGLEVSVNLSSCAGALKGPWEVGADAPKRLVCQTIPLTGGSRFDAVLKKPDYKYYWPVATFAVKYDGTVIEQKEEWLNAGDGLYTMKASSGKKIDGQKNVELRMAREIVELTKKVDGKGHLAWDVPVGQWALARFGYTTIDGHEYDVDVLDAKAVAGHFDRMGKTIIADAGPLAGKTLTHFYSVSWEGAVPTWTGTFEKNFAKYRGYSICPWLPVLAGFIVKSEDESKSFVSDYRRTRNDCFRDNFYGTMRKLSHKYGIKWHSESGGPWNRNPAVFGEADQLAFLAQNDMPQGEFWYTGKSDRTGRQMSRPQAITAHIYGKRTAAAEAFTHMVRHWTAYPAVLKRAGDESFCDGVNHLIWHTFTCSPREFGLPGTEYFAGTHVNPKVTWFEQAAPFMSYLGRCQYLLRQGLFAADVCVYVGDVPYQHWGRFATNWNATATMAMPNGHGYDIITTEVLLERIKVKNGKLVLPDGMSYSVMVVDLDDGQVSLAALKKIAKLKNAGVPVVFGSRKPQCTPGLAEGNTEVKQLGETLWASTPTLADTLKAKKLLPDFEGPFEYTHRCDKDTDIYFVAGTGKADCMFRVNGKQPELWNPVSGKIDVEVGWQAVDDGRTRLTLDLPQDGSMFVIFRKQGQPRPAAIPVVSKAEVALSGAWDVSFQSGRGAPASAVFDQLVGWDKHTDNGIKYFSGTATYRKTFEMTADQATRRALLQLGTVGVIAQVRLNGKNLGIVWIAPWQVELTGTLKAGKNELEIEVTNVWANRLIGDAGLPPEQRITKSNMALEKGKRTLKNYQGYASEDQLLPSGLEGPVRIELGQ
ncbi:MAG: glycosyl hydrolase [Kiritimatiellae bacterium]|nr:glycosyl hydrolase [Kiritimatiellia bacterium]MDD5519421.1 glycosyl hydrolase [Kiritimatiellia bacterium]